MHKHGACSGGKLTPEYISWRGMIQRCSDPKTREWEHYGARGIKVCERWRSDFQFFLVDMGKRPTSKHSIDRIDNDGTYEPKNCRWALPTEQLKNQRHGFFHEKRSRRMSDWWMNQSEEYRQDRAKKAARARWGG